MKCLCNIEAEFVGLLGYEVRLNFERLLVGCVGVEGVFREVLEMGYGLGVDWKLGWGGELWDIGLGSVGGRGILVGVIM